MGGPDIAPHAATSRLARGYFFSHLFEDAIHRPPAFSQSALVWNCDKSLAPDGLAEGELDEPLDEPPVAPGDVVVPLPGLDGVLDGVLPEPPPLGLVWAAATAGASAMIATKSANMSFCICLPPGCRVT